MKSKRTANRFSSIRSIWNCGCLIVFTMLALSVSYTLTSCKSNEGLATAKDIRAMSVTFELLSGYDYDKEQIPGLVKSLNGQRVVITGYMLPIDFEDNRVKSFLLLRNQMACCFGMTPRENEFIQVDMNPHGTTKYMPDWPITVVGKLEVGKRLLVNSIYRIQAENVLVLDGL